MQRVTLYRKKTKAALAFLVAATVAFLGNLTEFVVGGALRTSMPWHNLMIILATVQVITCAFWVYYSWKLNALNEGREV